MGSGSRGHCRQEESDLIFSYWDLFYSLRLKEADRDYHGARGQPIMDDEALFRAYQGGQAPLGRLLGNIGSLTIPSSKPEGPQKAMAFWNQKPQFLSPYLSIISPCAYTGVHVYIYI